MAPPLDGADRATVRFLPPGPYLGKKELARARNAERLPAKGLSRGTALLMSGCRDDQFSYDASFGGRPNGAFTRVALDTLAKLQPGATYADWHKEICKLLPSANYPQAPQLVGTSTQRKWQMFA